MAKLKAITPPKQTWSKTMTAEIAKATTDTLNTMKHDFERTVRGWNTRVIFTTQKSLKVSGDSLRGSVGTDNKIYGYVNNGTRAHIIRPKRAKALRFRTGYRPKTQFRTLISKSGGGAYGPYAYAQVVRHPGTAPREFDVTIADMRQPDYEQAVRKAIMKAVSDGS